jgi:SOS-response transcriptional repressor LexA
MTKAQLKALDYIKAYLAISGGVSPSYQEIADAMGLKSKSNAHRLVHALARAGRIRMLHNRARTLEVVDQPTLPVEHGRIPLEDLIKGAAAHVGTIVQKVRHDPNGETIRTREFERLTL